MYHNRNFTASLNEVSQMHCTRSLGLFNFKDMYSNTKGDIINGLEFMSYVENGKRLREAKFRCYCGNLFIARITAVRSGNTNSCSCLQKVTASKTHRKHGHADKNYLYTIWCHIKQRCYNSNNNAYKNYGGRGITVFLEWRHDYYSFKEYVLKYLGEKPEMHTLDRINNNGNYEPGNLRWATYFMQANNTRKCKKSMI